MMVLGIFALLIGASGVYAVLSSLVAQRTREIGVRIALGATPRRIVTSVLAQIGRYLAAGLAVGLPGAWLVARTFAGVFFQVRPTDLWIYVVVASMLAVFGIAAAVIPARRASMVDPLLALRAE
jgi:putative ABC transport system permease protein